MNSRGFRLTLNSLLAAAFVAAVAVPAITADAPLGGFVGSSGQIASEPRAPAAPAWKPAYVAKFPGCGPVRATELGDLVTIDQDAHVQRLDFGAAWAMNHNADRADDVWVVGWCR